MTKPKLTHSELMELISHDGPPEGFYPVYIVGIRGYYKNSMGAPGKNDRGIYDDAIFVVSGDESYAFNGNIDPSTYREGVGFDAIKGIASTKPGKYYCWKLDYHRNKYLALCQRLGSITVIRDGKPPYEQTSKYLGINSHRGGKTNTHSLGCWTVPPDQYDEYITRVCAEMRLHYGEIETGKLDSLKRPIYKDIIIPNILIEQ